MNAIHDFFIECCKQARIHHHLDAIQRKYRTMLEKIETEEIRAFEDDVRYEKLESLKEQLLQIRFIDK